MISRFLLIFLFVSICTAARSQTCYLPAPAGWETETFPIPIQFAPEIKHSGEEHIRFAPGWADVNSEEHWAYCFLWWIELHPQITEERLNEDLRSYYSGLIRANLVETKVKAATNIQTEAAFRKVKTERGDASTFHGTVRMFNYMTDTSAVVLNIQVHEIECAPHHTALLFLVSAQPRQHAVWSRLNAIRNGFKCTE
jgi:hypothetical protein